MHASVMAWGAEMIARYHLIERSVLDVGSLDVNGSFRQLFKGSYYGFDLREGPGVDWIGDAETFGAPIRALAAADVVVCTEVLEHVKHPWLVMERISQINPLYVLLSTRGFDERGCMGLHAHPDDYWRFSESAMRLLFDDAGLEILDLRADPEFPGWLVVGR